MSTLTLTNTFQRQQEAAELFLSECRAILAELQTNKYKGVKGISIESNDVDYRKDNRLHVFIAVLNTENNRCVLFEPRSDGTLQYWQYELKSAYKSAEALLRSRFLRDYFPKNGAEGMHIMDFELFCADPMPCNEFLQFSLPLVPV